MFQTINQASKSPTPTHTPAAPLELQCVSFYQARTTRQDMKAVPYNHGTCHSQENAFKKSSTENHKRCYQACTRHFTVKGTKSIVTKPNRNHSALYCGTQHICLLGTCILTLAISNMYLWHTH